MVSLTQLWLPILLSAVAVFVASSVFHMLLKFWHMPDYRGFSNDDEVRAAIRKGNPSPGMYMMPFCSMEEMGKPEVQQKFKEGPVGMIFMRPNGMQNMAVSMSQWFGFCLLVPLFAAYVAAATLTMVTTDMQVLRVVGTVAFMGFAMGEIPSGIWWSHPWKSVVKHMIDGLVYALITGAIFAWMWPQPLGG